RQVEVLVEGLSKTALKHEETGPKQLTGRTRTDHIVVFDGNPRLIGQIVAVDIVEATAFTLFGKVVTEERIGVHCREVSGAIGNVDEKVTTERRIGLPVIED